MRIAFIAIGAAALLMVVACGASDNEKLGGPWIIEHVSPWGPDGRHAKYLAREGRWRPRRVSGQVFDARYVEPDCVIYSEYDHGLYAVCGDRQPIYIATLGDRFADLRPDVILVGDAGPTTYGPAPSCPVETERWHAQPRQAARQGCRGPHREAARSVQVAFRIPQFIPPRRTP